MGDEVIPNLSECLLVEVRYIMVLNLLAYELCFPILLHEFDDGMGVGVVLSG
jgi:hypothetical protein